ncbi:hypothetical protein [Kitasatospora sp. NPDC085879]|uniref:hypothetical protein n=1 Tax=Kitasatospora sp. NPDC085879 TaxID=3154769 RepID=UPI000BB0E62D|nr:hypothetical protein [Streptomyces sp. TLI_235]PBC70526.1 hypothetical protein BX265_5066 [Streptomyces sp. TLI_235]
MELEPDPAAAYTDELLALVGGLQRPAADAFVRRVFEGGAAHGARTALANVAAAENEKDAQIRRLGERLVALGEDPLAVARLLRGA